MYIEILLSCSWASGYILLMESSSQVQIGVCLFLFCLFRFAYANSDCAIPPHPQFQCWEMLLGACELDSITRSLTFARQPEFFPTLKLGVGGESLTRCKGVMVFTCELDSTY